MVEGPLKLGRTNVEDHVQVVEVRKGVGGGRPLGRRSTVDLDQRAREEPEDLADHLLEGGPRRDEAVWDEERGRPRPGAGNSDLGEPQARPASPRLARPAWSASGRARSRLYKCRPRPILSTRGWRVSQLPVGGCSQGRGSTSTSRWKPDEARLRRPRRSIRSAGRRPPPGPGTRQPDARRRGGRRPGKGRSVPSWVGLGLRGSRRMN